MNTEFTGFPRECPTFLADLEENNDREWFKRNKTDFEEFVLDPARRFVTAMGERLSKIAPGIHAEPRIDKSIFRIHRDTRFSNDKRPFKTHLGIYFWEGAGKKLECPGFYFHLEKDKLLLGGGMHIFPREYLDTYRASVDDARLGAALETILADGRKFFPAAMDLDNYKRIPGGYSKDHLRADLLKRKGVTLGEESELPSALFGPESVDYVFHRFEKMLPLHKWLLAMVHRTAATV